MTIQSSEIEINGAWIEQNGKMVADPNSVRIADLIANKLLKLAVADGGFSTLYVNQSDSRLWELSYPQSDGHGGGPPRLSQISSEDASLKYKF